MLGGDSRGIFASTARGGLWVLSWAYSLGARFRRWQFDTGRRDVHRADVPVISVGNLTTGGTGKTPVVAEICRRLRAVGCRVAILSRGYGATTGYNDEAMELTQRMPDVPLVQHPDRVQAARIAVDELECEVLVLDDGFQHRRLHRDLDVVVIDATCPFGFGHMLPRGYLREPISSLRRADLVILTHVDQIDPPMRKSIIERIHRHRADMPIVETCHRPAMLGRFQGTDRPIDSLRGQRVACLSAIGSPDTFARTLRDCGARIVDRLDLPDHDPFDRATRDRCRQWVRSITPPPAMIVCTVKDFVKLETDSIAGVPLLCLRIDLQCVSDDEPLNGRLRAISHPSTMEPDDVNGHQSG